MGDALSRCERADVTIHTNFGPETISAMRMGDFACHDGVGRYRGRIVISHLPTGFSTCTAGVFEKIEDAATAMERLIAECDFSGDWGANSTKTPDDRRALGDKVKCIFKECGATFELAKA